MSKIRLSLSKVRRKYYERMMVFCIDRSLTTDNVIMSEIWIKYFNRYFNKLITIRDDISFQTSKEES